MKMFLVLSPHSEEGVVLQNKDDALFASTGEMQHGMVSKSSLAVEFRELYSEFDERTTFELSTIEV